MSTKLDSDVIIAGAGPAGAAAATHMAKAGLRVILADRQEFPRDKVCGDFVSPVALRELAALGVTRGREYKRSHSVKEAALYLDGQHLLTAAIPSVSGSGSPGRVIPRKVLDAWIVARARSAGADVREGCYVKGYRARRRSVEVSVQTGARMRTLRAQVLIGADGSSSTVARLASGNAALEDDRIIAVRGYFAGVKGPAGRADLYFTSESFPGYCWLFPTGSSEANVGVGMAYKTFPPPSDHLRELLLRLVAEDRVLRRRLAGAQLVGNIVGWPLATYNGRLPLVSERVLLVGDAGGLINPLNGEGIQYALLSGRWAAETVAACAARGDFSRAGLHPYAARVDAELRYDLTVARSLVQLIRNRSLNPLWLEALQVIVARAAVDPEYARITGGVLAGVIPVRSVLGLGVVRKTLEQAAVRLGAQTVRNLSYRPKHIAQLGVKATQAAIDTLSAMLQHRSETERWGAGVVMSALDLAAAARREMVASVSRRSQVPRVDKAGG